MTGSVGHAAGKIVLKAGPPVAAMTDKVELCVDLELIGEAGLVSGADIALGNGQISDVPLDTVGLIVDITPVGAQWAACVRTDGVRPNTEDMGPPEDDVKVDTADSVGMSCTDATTDRFGIP